MLQKHKTPIALAISFAIGSFSPVLIAATVDDEQEVEQIVIVGSRAAPRSVNESPVPVDVIGAEEISNQGNPDMLNLISQVVPSFNVNTQAITDAASLVRPANLRGLPPDNTLVLVNGKRRHRSSVITFIGGGISDGSQGPDISVIPSIALKQVEILKDGAAAQYGSDAIAGVINFVLRDDPDGGSFEAKYGEFYAGDGGNTMFAANIGMPFTENGFANFSGEWKDVDETSRSQQRDDAQALIDAGNMAVPVPAQVWGQPDVSNDFKFFANIGLDLDDDQRFYLFANWAERETDGGFYYRNPQTRNGVFSADGGQTLLVGDLTPDDGIGCPVVNITNNILDPVAFGQVTTDPNCFAFNELFPGGFTPRFGGTVTDSSITSGVKGETKSGVRYDVSASVGQNEAEFTIRNTVNASLGFETPTQFNPGKYLQREKRGNIDLSKDFQFSSLEEPIVVSAGFEIAEETFEITAGDIASWEIGPLASQGFSIGSNGFPGFKPEDAGTFDRRNYSFYVDVESYVHEDLLLGTAIRYEHYDDFGVTTNGKFTYRYQFIEDFAVRGSISTGFRAPTVGQSNVRNVTTNFGPNGLQDQATLPPTNAIAIQKGATPLEPEESVAMTFGVTGNVGDFYLTVDYFNIDIRDRIAQTSNIPLTDEDIAVLLAQGIRDAQDFTFVKFFTNDFDTTTQGVDVVANYDMELFGGDTKFTLAYNWTHTEIDSFNPDIIDNTRIRQVEDGVPDTRTTFTTNYSYGDWRALFRANYYGTFYEAHLDDGGLPIEVGSEITFDLELGYQLTETLNLTVGAQNLFDNFPDQHEWQGIGGSVYPVTSPMGFGGGFWYARMRYTF